MPHKRQFWRIFARSPSPTRPERSGHEPLKNLKHDRAKRIYPLAPLQGLPPGDRLKHSSAALSLNENADTDVKTDMTAIFDRLVRERETY